MTQTLSNRFAGFVFASALVLAAWLPTVSVPVATASAAPAAVELA